MNPLLRDESRPRTASVRNSRREARESALQVLYAFEFSGEKPDVLIEDICDLFSEQAMKFIRDLVNHAVTHREKVDELIRSKTENWDFDRIAVIDRLLLRVGICEFMFFEDIPPKVSINEVIEIGKRYSTDNSSRFINGILDSVLEDLKRDGGLHKVGRGIIGD